MTELPLAVAQAHRDVAVAAEELIIGWGNYAHHDPELIELEDKLIEAVGNLKKARNRG